MKLTEDFKTMLAASMTQITDQINSLKYSPTEYYSPNPLDPTTVVLDKRRSLPLDSGTSTKNNVMWTLKNEIISPKLYELLIKIELIADIDMDLKNFYNHVNMCLNALNILLEIISSWLPVHQNTL